MPPEVKTNVSIVSTGTSGAKVEKTEVEIVYTHFDGTSSTTTFDDHIVLTESGDYLPGSSGTLEKAESALAKYDEDVEKSMAESLARWKVSENGSAEPQGRKPKP